MLTSPAVNVADNDVLGEVGKAADLIEAIRDRAAIGMAAEMLGSATQAFDITLDYLKTRVQFGAIIGSFQALQHRAVDLYAALRLTTAALNAVIDTARDDGNLVLAAARARRRALSGSEPQGGEPLGT